MKFAFVLYVCYLGALLGFVYDYPSGTTVGACIFLAFFGAWFSRMMWSLEKINTTLLKRESMHQLILKEHEHNQQLWNERYYNSPTNPGMVVYVPTKKGSHSEWARGEPTMERDNPWTP